MIRYGLTCVALLSFLSPASVEPFLEKIDLFEAGKERLTPDDTSEYWRDRLEQLEVGLRMSRLRGTHQVSEVIVAGSHGSHSVTFLDADANLQVRSSRV